MSSDSNPTSVDLGHSKLKLRPDGILEMHCEDDIIYEVNHIKEIIHHTGKLTNGKKCKHLTVAGKYTSISDEAKKFIATDEAVIYTIAEAYVIQSLSQKLFANFYLKFSKPKVPTKVLTDFEKALNWLSSI